MSAGPVPQQPPSQVAPRAGPGRDRAGSKPPPASATHRRVVGVPSVAAVRVGDERSVGRASCGREQGRQMARGCAIDTDRDDPGVVADRERIRHGLPGGCGRRRRDTGTTARPGPRARRGADEHLGFADGRDRLERQQVDAGLEERLDPRRVDVAQRGRAGVVVAAILGAVGEHRAVRADRARDEELSAGRRPASATYRSRARRASSTLAGSPRARPPGRARPPRTRARSPGSWPSSRPAHRPGSSRGGGPRWRPGRSAAAAPTRAGRTGRGRAPRARSPGRRRGRRRPPGATSAIRPSGRGRPAPA